LYVTRQLSIFEDEHSTGTRGPPRRPSHASLSQIKTMEGMRMQGKSRKGAKQREEALEPRMNLCTAPRRRGAGAAAVARRSVGSE